MGKWFDNYKKDFKKRNWILSNVPGLFYFLVFIVIVWILVIIIVAFGFSNSSKKSNNEEELEKEDKISCLQLKKEIGNKLIQLGFKQPRDFQLDYYEKDNITVIISDYNYSISIKNFNIEKAYSLISNFYEISHDLFTKIVNNLMLSSKKRKNYESLYIIKDNIRTIFNYANEGTLTLSTEYCNLYKQNNKYYYDFYTDINNLEYDKYILKSVFNYDLRYIDFINYFVNETILTGQANWLKDHILTIYGHSRNIVSYEFYDNSSNGINYNVTHRIEDYKEKLKTDLTYIDNYFNEDSMKYYDFIIEKIENKDYLSGDKKTGTSTTGNYYAKTYSLDNNTRLTLNVYEDKIGFYISFKE